MDACAAIDMNRPVKHEKELLEARGCNVLVHEHDEQTRAQASTGRCSDADSLS